MSQTFASSFVGAAAKRAFISTTLAACCALIAAGVPVSAQTYPSRPIKAIVPFPAGGGTDATARIVAEHLSHALGKNVIVENRGGAEGVVGTEAAARSAPDGYTILITADSITSIPHVLKMTIDPTKDLVPVIQLTRQPVVLAVHPSLGANSIDELIALAKQRPGMGYATSGLAAPQSIAPLWFARIAGIRLAPVPYRGGGPAINDLIAGHVKIGSVGSAPLIPHYKVGNVRLLAQTAKRVRRACRKCRPFRKLASRDLCSTNGSASLHRQGRHPRLSRVSMPKLEKFFPIHRSAKSSWKPPRSRWAAAPSNSLGSSVKTMTSIGGWWRN
jgi:tripartite-type tricarboxylate transporter receptor subunit TctC